LISIYLKGESISWPKEIKIAKKLLALYPIDFFRQYEVDAQVFSLALFLTPLYKINLEKQFSFYNLTKPKIQATLSDKPLIAVEVSDTKKQPRTLQEFVDSTL